MAKSGQSRPATAAANLKPLATCCSLLVLQPLVQTADALHYHVPHWLGKPRRKAFANQLRLAMSLESSAYYEELDDPSYMCHFDAEMTYRHCAQVTK